MIARDAKYYCREDLSLVENYDKALADKNETWVCHHRDEIKILPSGIKVIRTKYDLIENDRYYYCPANELIFMRACEHTTMHCKGITTWNKGKKWSEETKRKMSVAATNRKRAPLSEETKRKISAKMRARHDYQR